MSPPYYSEEFKYIQNVANRLLKYQVETTTNESNMIL